MCDQHGMSRRNFLKTSLIGGAGIAAGLGHGHLDWAHAQAANIRFSTWHVPVGYEVKTVWEPMLEQLKKKSENKITSTMFPGGALGKGSAVRIVAVSGSILTVDKAEG